MFLEKHYYQNQLNKKHMNKIILASASPRRKELLQKAGIDFIIDASSIDETMDMSLPIDKRIAKLAQDKAQPIHEKYPDDIVIGADTVVYLDDMIIGKAKDEEDAYRIHALMSNRKHTVLTGVAIYFKDQLVSFTDSTDVYFKDTADLVDDYIQSNDWIGKAGAYAIQGKADIFVDHIEGDINTVIGLPVQRVIDELNKYFNK